MYNAHALPAETNTARATYRYGTMAGSRVTQFEISPAIEWTLADGTTVTYDTVQIVQGQVGTSMEARTPAGGWTVVETWNRPTGPVMALAWSEWLLSNGNGDRYLIVD